MHGSNKYNGTIATAMRYLAQVAALILASVVAGFAQTAAEPPKSLAEVARDSQKEKKPAAKIVLSDENQQLRKSIIPDVFSGGVDNYDDILKAIEDYRRSHNLQETENVVHLWYDKHDAILAEAIEENRRIEQRERDRQMGYPVTDAQPRSQQEYVEMRTVEIISRREDSKHKQENGLLMARIQQAFTRIRPVMKSKYGMNVEWMKIRCGNGNCSF
jgi:hypothetical protein